MVLQDEILHYIDEARSYGLSDEQIKTNLTLAGWSSVLVEESFVFIEQQKNKDATKDALVFEAAQPFVSEQVKLKKGYKSFLKPVTRVVTHWSFLLIVVLIVGGFFSYRALIARGYWLQGFHLVSYRTVWQNFLNSDNPNNYTSHFAFSYTDHATLSSDSADLLPSVFNVMSDENRQTDDVHTVLYAETLHIETQLPGNEKQSKALKLISKGNDLYFSPTASDMAGTDEKQNWSVVHLPFKSFGLPVFSFTKNFLRSPSYVGIESIDNRSLVHLKADVNFSALEDALNLVVFGQLTGGVGPGFDSQDKVILKSVLHELMTRSRVNSFDMWLGVSDAQLYRVTFNAVVPSVKSVAVNAPTKLFPNLHATHSLIAARFDAARDAKRLEDIKNLSQAFELYYNDHGHYPEARQGIPQDLSPKYVPALPVAPQATGDCSDYYNTYWYENQPVEKSTDPLSGYRLTFCLGRDAQNLTAGLGYLTPKGITTSRDCVDEKQSCFVLFKTDEQIASDISSFFSFLSNDGVISYDQIFKSFDKTDSLVVPADATDVTTTYIHE